MDKIDSAILEILEKDARASYKDLATMAGVSEEEVKKRVESLKSSGIIRAFKTLVDWTAACEKEVTAYIDVKVTPETRTGFSELGRLIAANEMVEEVCVTSGEYDLTIKLRVKDISDVSNFVTDVLAPKKIITGTYTHFVLRKFKENGVVLGVQAKDKLVISA
jgi:DNA-binding Lrp family transcriptional regulator